MTEKAQPPLTRRPPTLTPFYLTQGAPKASAFANKQKSLFEIPTTNTLRW